MPPRCPSFLLLRSEGPGLGPDHSPIPTPLTHAFISNTSCGGEALALTSFPNSQLTDLTSPRDCQTDSSSPCVQGHTVGPPFPGDCSSQNNPSWGQALGPSPDPDPRFGHPEPLTPALCPRSPASAALKPSGGCPRLSGPVACPWHSALPPVGDFPPLLCPCGPFSPTDRVSLWKSVKCPTPLPSPTVRAGVPNTPAQLPCSCVLCDLTSCSPGPTPQPPLSSLDRAPFCTGTLSPLLGVWSSWEPRAYCLISSKSWSRCI